MTRTLAFALTLLLSVGAAAHDTEEAAIAQVIDRAYVHGVHIDRDAEMIRGGMHESFVMFVLGKDGLSQVTRDAWIERLSEAKAKAEPDAPKPNMTADIKVLDRSGDAAVARVNLFRDGKQIFTDYISLYRFADGWKMVGKTFQRHPVK